MRGNATYPAFPAGIANTQGPVALVTHDLRPAVSPTPRPPRCARCGQALEHQATGRRRRYCTDACRAAAFRVRHTLRPTRCVACRQRLEPSSTRPRRYCDDACRQAAARARRKRSVHFSSATDEWATPQSRFDELNAEFAPGFDLDVCATADNAKCARYFTRGDDGLVQTWTGVCWMNPPYGRAIGAWVQKAYE
jgi:hypothetical protein